MKIDPLFRLGKFCKEHVQDFNPWTNVYGVGRTLLALSTCATLLFTRSDTLFRRAWGISEVPVCGGVSRGGLFCALPNHLELARWISVVVLLVVASGWRPRFTAPLHWWVSFSLASSAVLVDGGDQVCELLTLFLLPIALTDSRPSHWQSVPNPAAPPWKRLVAASAVVALRIQVAGIYLHASVGKLAVQEWTDGTALYYWLIHPAFGAPPAVWRILEPFARHGWTLTAMTWGAILVELSLFTALVMPKWAWGYFLVIGLAFHAGIALMHGLISFSMAMAGALVLYLRPANRPFALPSFAHSRTEPVPCEVASAERYQTL